MASYFGEVLESSSRAFDGDCEDVSRLNDPFITASEYELSWIACDDPAETDLFIIVDGKCALGISECLHSNATKIAQITELLKETAGDEPSSKKSQAPSFIYRLTNGIYLCEVNSDVKVSNANYFTSKLHGFLKKSKEVLILTTKTSHGYMSLKNDIPPFVRGLCNTSFSDNGRKLLAPIIDTANIITGVPASVLTWCALMKVMASMYVCYTPKEDMDSVVWGLFMKLFNDLSAVKDLISKVQFDTKERSTVTHTGNLYL